MNDNFLKRYSYSILFLFILLIIIGYIISISELTRILLGIIAGVLIYAGSKTIIDLTLDQYKTLGEISKNLFKADQFIRNDWKNIPGISEIEK